MLAFALVNALARRPDAKKLFGFSAGGLRDTVRIAGSSPEMWRDICVANRDALLAVLDDYQDELEQREVGDRERRRRNARAHVRACPHRARQMAQARLISPAVLPEPD